MHSGTRFVLSMWFTCSAEHHFKNFLVRNVIYCSEVLAPGLRVRVVIDSEDERLGVASAKRESVWLNWTHSLTHSLTHLSATDSSRRCHSLAYLPNQSLKTSIGPRTASITPLTPACQTVRRPRGSESTNASASAGGKQNCDESKSENRDKSVLKHFEFLIVDQDVV